LHAVASNGIPVKPIIGAETYGVLTWWGKKVLRRFWLS
jgi:hypothetical protein